MHGLNRPIVVLTCGFLASVSCGSKGSPAAPPPPPASVTVSSVSVSGGSSVVAGQTVQLAATANMSNSTTQNVSATGTWASSNTGVATVSSTGLATGVAAGSAQIRATFQSVTGEASLQVTPPAPSPPVARFTVGGPGGNDTCRIIVNSGGDFDCTFDGSTSSGGTGGAVTAWTWRFDVGGNSSLPITRNTPTLVPDNRCGSLDPTKAPQQGSTGFVQMIVKLEVRNASGTTSAELRNSNVRLFPQNQCGFGF